MIKFRQWNEEATMTNNSCARDTVAVVLSASFIPQAFCIQEVEKGCLHKVKEQYGT